MRYRFYTADVFTDQVFGGNPLAVFPDARGLSGHDMQRIAREFNLSETVFVLPAEQAAHTRRLRIFTPAAELPFAGHPTVGCAHVLATIGEIPLTGEETRIVFEEEVGPVAVTIQGRRNQPETARLTVAKLPEFGPQPPPVADLAQLLTLETADVAHADWTPQAVSCGVPFLCIPIRNRDALARSRLRLDLWQNLLSTFWAPSVYLFTPETEQPGSDWRTRMYAPAMGVPEDPATGAAAVAFAGYLATRDATRDGPLRWTIEQGFEMGRPSILIAEADKIDGAVTAVRVGGSAVLVTDGWMDVPLSEA
ncbi:MAG: PhzF family phenazine biosynthesis protein [Gammaproteobacteria bacterium]|nr:PhzF family phenazine biosynthesis protein [Gammaproteobacteria bacterium]MCP5424786.1 PhzF family phenazine biosynthesis protein [Gammaproteobacteria bacterium]MCP5458237.1 PhzF family phenazine biosynthesis protein [Gammaproteobacteria bacterium]